MAKKVMLPLTDETLDGLKAGDNILLTGTMYVGRDTAHKRMVEALEQGRPLPFDIKGQTIYFMGPSPARPGQPIGSAGPTTSGRMDSYSPRLIAEGLKGMIGKGMRSEAVKDAIKQYKAVYFGAIGGGEKLVLMLAKYFSADVITTDLNTESIKKMGYSDTRIISLGKTSPAGNKLNHTYGTTNRNHVPC